MGMARVLRLVMIKHSLSKDEQRKINYSTHEKTHTMRNLKKNTESRVKKREKS